MATMPRALGSDDKTGSMNPGQETEVKITDMKNLVHGIMVEKFPNMETTRVTRNHK